MPVPATFKAAVLHESGARHTIEERSLGPLEPGEIAVKITATAINPIDWKIRDLGWWIKEYPTVLGSDAAGEVAELGPDVSSVKVGDRVFFQGIIGSVDHSTFQQYARIPAALVSKTPPISDEAAAGVHLATMAALTGFYDSSGRGLPAPWDHDGDRVGNNKAIIILGGSSSVGQYAIQLAGRSGYELIVTNASATHKELLTKLGTNVVLDRSPKAVPKPSGMPSARYRSTLSLTPSRAPKRKSWVLRSCRRLVRHLVVNLLLSSSRTPRRWHWRAHRSRLSRLSMWLGLGRPRTCGILASLLRSTSVGRRGGSVFICSVLILLL